MHNWLPTNKVQYRVRANRWRSFSITARHSHQTGEKEFCWISKEKRLGRKVSRKDLGNRAKLSRWRNYKHDLTKPSAFHLKWLWMSHKAPFCRQHFPHWNYLKNLMAAPIWNKSMLTMLIYLLKKLIWRLECDARRLRWTDMIDKQCWGKATLLCFRQEVFGCKWWKTGIS